MAFINNKKNQCKIHVIEPLVNITENDNEVVIEAEMSGLAKEDVSLDLKGDELTLRGRTKQFQESIPKGYTIIHKERCPLEYERAFIIGDDIDRNKISAEYRNGVLKVILVRVAASQPKKIEIKE